MSTTITTEGNLTADVELRWTKVTGQAVCSFRLAVSARRKNMAGEYVDTAPVFYEATCWGALAEHLVECRKGDRLLVHGTTYDEDWTDRDGHTRTKHVLQVTTVGVSLRYATAQITRQNTKTAVEAKPEPTQLG